MKTYQSRTWVYVVEYVMQDQDAQQRHDADESLSDRVLSFSELARPERFVRVCVCLQETISACRPQLGIVGMQS